VAAPEFPDEGPSISVNAHVGRLSRPCANYGNDSNLEKRMNEKLNPLALTIDQAARVLTASGWKPVTHQMVEADIEDGAPTNADGSLNLMHYTAWLVKEMSRRDG